jgi:hypothetical protein
MSDMPITSGDTRPLTRGEIELAKKLFGNSMNYEDVRIQNGKETIGWQVSSYIGNKCGAKDTCCRAQTISSTMYMPTDQYRDDYSKGNEEDRSLFVHEMTHVWQFQNLQVRAGAKTIEDVFKAGCYDDVYKYKIDPKKDLGEYNVEQQACIMERYYWYLQREGTPIEAPKPMTPEDYEKSLFGGIRLKAMAQAYRKNPEDPTIAQLQKDGLIRFDADGSAHYTQAYADKHNVSAREYIAQRKQEDYELLQVMASFRQDPNYLDQSSAVKTAVVIAGVIAPTVVVPVVLIGTAAVKTYEAASIAIDTYGIWAQTDAMIDDMTAPRKHMNTDQPQLSNYVQCLMSNARFSHHMRTDLMKGNIEKTGDGRIANMRDIDFSIPENRAEFLRMIDTELPRQQRIRDDNSSIMPRWIRSGNSVQLEAMANADIKMLENAKRELAMFDREMAVYNQNKAQFGEVFDLHKKAAMDMTQKLGANPDAATVRSAVTQFLKDEEQVRAKAQALPDNAQRQQLLRECDVNTASGNFSLASAAETPQEAVAAMERAKDYMQRAGLDPAQEASYKAFGTTKAEFEQRLDIYKAQTALPMPQLEQKGYLSAQFGGAGEGQPVPAAPAPNAAQPQRLQAAR